MAGGDFVEAGSIQGYRVASWDGAAWNPLGSHGIPLRVFALAEYQGSLVAAGHTVAGYNIMRWTGSDWIGIPGGPAGDIVALAEFGGDLFAVGAFGIEAWDGTSWSVPGGNIDGVVTCLASHQGNLYAGGNFGLAGNTVANFIARWTGSTWSAVKNPSPNNFNPGPNNEVLSLLSRNDSLFVGGRFTEIAYGDTMTFFLPDTTFTRQMDFILETPRLALWVGGGSGNWSNDGSVPIDTNTVRIRGVFGAGVDGDVVSLFSFGSQLVVGGTFGGVDGVPANNAAFWESGTWSSIGAGLGGTMYTPTVWTGLEFQGSLFVGGGFQTAGSSPSNFIAQWIPTGPQRTSVPTIAAGWLAGFKVRVRSNPVTRNAVTIELTGRMDGPVLYSVYDIQGRRLWRTSRSDGLVEWDLRGANGRRVPAGKYFVSARSGSRFASTSFVVLR